MKRWVLIVLVGIIGFIAAPLLGWGQDDDFGNEPNALDATLLPDENAEINGSIEVVGDTDCFMFEGVTQTTYTLETSNLSGNLDSLLVLFDRNGRTVLAVDDDGGQDRASKLEFTPAFEGLYFVCVRNARATQGVGDYTLTVTNTTAEDTPTTVTPPSPTPDEPEESQTPDTPSAPTAPTTPPTTEPVRPTTPSGTVLREGLVALVGGDDEASLRNVQGYLVATGNFPAVEIIDAAQSTPSANELNQYEAVLVWADSGFQDADTLGDRLADYVDRGGGVVVAAVSFDVPDPFDPDTLGGRFLSGNYYAIQPDTDNVESDRHVLGSVNNPSHPVMRGVTKIDGGPRSVHSPTSSLTSGASVIASWDNGDVLVAVKTVGQANRVDVNLFPPSSLLDPDLWPFTPDNDVPRLMSNALLWAAGRQTPFTESAEGQPGLLEINPVVLDLDAREGASTADNRSLTLRNAGGLPLTWSATVDANWLSLDPLQGELQPGATQAVIVSADLSTLPLGTHNATITIATQGAESGLVRVPVSLTFGVATTTPVPPSTSIPSLPNLGTGQVLRVPGDVSNLEDAIAQAAAGDTIEIASGTYLNTALTLDKPVTLSGAGDTILRGTGQAPVITINPGVAAALNRLILTAGDDGLAVLDGAQAVLDGVLVVNNAGWGIRLLGPSSFTASASRIDSNRSGGITFDIGEAANRSLRAALTDNVIQNNTGCGIHVASDEPGIQISGSGNLIVSNAVDVCDNANKLPNGFLGSGPSAGEEVDPEQSALEFDDDGDGVPDSEDFCPITPGKKDNNGCP